MKVIYDEIHAKQRKEEYDAKINGAKGKVYKFLDRYIIGPVYAVVGVGCFFGMLCFIKNDMVLWAWGALGALLGVVVLGQIFMDKIEAFFETPLEVAYLNALLQGGENPALILEKNKDADSCLIKLETEKDGVREAKEIGVAKIEFCSSADIDEQTLDFTKEVLCFPFANCEKLFVRTTVTFSGETIQ